MVLRWIDGPQELIAPSYCSFCMISIGCYCYSFSETFQSGTNKICNNTDILATKFTLMDSDVELNLDI